MSPTHHEAIEYARFPEGIVVIRVNGKGTHQNSASLRHVFDLTKEQNPASRYILDLAQCVTMDSTFMGTLASIALYQKSRTATLPIVLNLQDHVRRLMDTLGLKYMMDMRADRSLRLPLEEAAYTEAASPEMGKVERIVMMIEAHERLVDIDSENEVKFEGVLKSLRESLNREQGA